jgi:hypothetical protein
MTKIEEEIFDLLTQINDIELAKELKHKITEYKKSDISSKVYEVFQHKTIQFIRNSQSDAEVRRYVINAYNNCK